MVGESHERINQEGDEALSDEITDMDQWMRQMIAEQHLPEDTWFVLRSNAGASSAMK